jgi:NADH-quinone oxidoreductase subunit I
MGVIKDIKNLIKGMGITGKHLGRHAITVQYPEERDNIPERSRGIVVLLSDKETGELNCTACMLCMRVCPTAAIKIDAPRDEKKKRHLQSFVVDNSLCCYCGLCEEVCNMYEFSTYDKEELIWDMNKLQEMGRDVPYEAKPKKKPAAAAKPAAKPDSEKPAAEKQAAASNPDKAGEKKPDEEQKPAAEEKPAEEKKPEAEAKPAAEDKKDEPVKKPEEPKPSDESSDNDGKET